MPRFVAAAHIAGDPEAYGFSLQGSERFSSHETLKIDKPVDLSLFSRNAGISLRTLQFLNPELNRIITPVGRSYMLRVPEERLSIVPPARQGRCRGRPCHRAARCAYGASGDQVLDSRGCERPSTPEELPRCNPRQRPDVSFSGTLCAFGGRGTHASMG